MPLEIDKQVGDRITYKPFVGKVIAHSTYNKKDPKTGLPVGRQRFAIEGADDFWALDKGVLDSKPELGVLPPVGIIAKWTLQKAPVTGQFAEPGKEKFYRDVIKVEAVSQAEPAATAEDAAYDGYVEKQVKRPAGAIGPDDRVPAIWELPKSYHERMEVIKRESIERQAVMQADGTLLAVLLAIKTPTDETKALIDAVTYRYEKLADLLAALPKATPEQAGKDVEDLPWDDSEKK